MLLKVTPELLDEIWPRAAKWLEPAIERDGLTDKETVYNSIKSGYNQLWVCETAAAVTCLEDYPKGRVCFLWLAGGSDLSKILSHLSDMEQWAQAMDCSKIRVTGRKGWKRLLDEYSEPYITLEKTL